MERTVQDHMLRAAEEEVSKGVCPEYWRLAGERETSREADLAEALTLHDFPCQSYFQA